MVTIRTYYSGDLSRLIEMFRSTVRSVNRRDYTAEQTLAWAPDTIDAKQWAERITANRCWVATDDVVPVGFIELGAKGLIDMLYVHHSHQRQGIGTRLLKQLEQATAESKQAELHTHASITSGPFFEANGFRVDAAQQVIVRGQTLLTYLMRKTL